MWVVLAMGSLTDLPIQQVFRHSRRLRRDASTAHQPVGRDAVPGVGIDPAIPRKLGRRTGLRRTKDAPRSASRRKVRAPPQRNAGRRASRNGRLVAGPLRRSRADVRGRSPRAAGRGPALVHWLLAHPAMPPPRMRQPHRSDANHLVRNLAGGNAPRTTRPPPQPHQSPRHQTQNVEVAQKASSTSATQAFAETFSRLCGYG